MGHFPDEELLFGGQFKDIVSYFGFASEISSEVPVVKVMAEADTGPFLTGAGGRRGLRRRLALKASMVGSGPEVMWSGHSHTSHLQTHPIEARAMRNRAQPGLSQVTLVIKSSLRVQETEETRAIPGSGRSPGGRHCNPLQHSCLEDPMDRGAWRGATVHGVTQGRTRLRQLSPAQHIRLSDPTHPTAPDCKVRGFFCCSCMETIPLR